MDHLINFTNNLWESPSLEGVVIIGAQHLMESTLGLFRNLKKQGLDPSQTFLIGKCYSTSESVFSDFEEEGFNVSPYSFLFDSHQSYDVFYREKIILFVEEVAMLST